MDVLKLVGRRAREQAPVDRVEPHPPQGLGGGDPPGPEEGRREQPELLPRKVPARPRKLPAAQVAARRELALGVLQGGQHEQVAALVIAVVLAPDALERSSRVAKSLTAAPRSAPTSGPAPPRGAAGA